MSIRLLRDVAILGMLAAFFAILPAVLSRDASEGAAVRRGCSVAALIVWTGLYLKLLRDVLRAVRSETFSSAEVLIGLVITLLGLGLLAANVIALSAVASQRYTLDIVCLLVLAGLNFLGGAFALRVRPPVA